MQDSPTYVGASLVHCSKYCARLNGLSCCYIDRLLESPMTKSVCFADTSVFLFDNLIPNTTDITIMHNAALFILFIVSFLIVLN